MIGNCRAEAFERGLADRAVHLRHPQGGQFAPVGQRHIGGEQRALANADLDREGRIEGLGGDCAVERGAQGSSAARCRRKLGGVDQLPSARHENIGSRMQNGQCIWIVFAVQMIIISARLCLKPLDVQ